MAGLPLKPGDTGPMVQQMQSAIIAKGNSVGPAGANGVFNEDTLVGLQAFQDGAALPVKPECDQQCWTALGLPGPQEGAGD
jgi:peptidoglycan hydrolase-like protein with peptidoglycan-binding domain